jgi:hypothetical protein
MKPFDEEFAENVREAFENYLEPVDEKAWEQMQNRLQKTSKVRTLFITPLFIRATAAIVFLIAASGSLWLLVHDPEKSDSSPVYGSPGEMVVIPAEEPADDPVTNAMPEMLTEIGSGRDREKT